MSRAGLLAAWLLFGASIIPTQVQAREAVAELFGQTIYRDELNDQDALSRIIIGPLMQRYAESRKIAATPAEMADLQDWLGELAAERGQAPLIPTTQEERRQMHDFLEGMVVNWKINQALYKQYGGEVIFQQADPLEPVGAMRQFIEDEEASGTFKIFDDAERERFFAYYRRRNHPGGFSPPERVDFSVPWWRLKPR